MIVKSLWFTEFATTQYNTARKQHDVDTAPDVDLWPAFLVAGVIEMLVFAMVDPKHLHWFGQPVTLSRQASTP